MASEQGAPLYRALGFVATPDAMRLTLAPRPLTAV